MVNYVKRKIILRYSPIINAILMVYTNQISAYGVCEIGPLKDQFEKKCTDENWLQQFPLNRD